MRWFIAAVFACIAVSSSLKSAIAQEENQPILKVPSYECHRVETKAITVDGKLNESCWKMAAHMPFRGLVDGSEPAFETITRIVWDDKYLYVSYDVRDPDVWARSALLDTECSEEYALRAFFNPQDRASQWTRLECNVMYIDKYVKVFLDPDADGKRYVEFHVNPLNAIFDAWYDQGYKQKWGDQPRGDHVTWTCEGLVTAVHIDGTLNAPHDVDQGWSVEMAIPWKALAPFTNGACPPKAGDVWTAHLGRTQRNQFASRTTSWTWPVIGKPNCHLPATYGHLIFKDDQAKPTSPSGQGERTPPKTSDENTDSP